jgi:hypothetical protein
MAQDLFLLTISVVIIAVNSIAIAIAPKKSTTETPLFDV